ncbi:MAG TPA: arginase [Candidatus Ventrousia excrementavium]|uniref:Arginase n=1 Tax=Candidatus Ventrousia excrementavium TaxID=2840961 RepID=A0A9D1IVM3_9CLOT|nr:arginase [Candidatus Ventrousia excrementavium]
MQQGRKVDVIGIQMDLGASRRGVNMGPSAIRYSGLLEKMKGLGLSPRDCGDIIPRIPQGDGDPTMRHAGEINEANERLYCAVRESLRSGAMPVVLGGDHCVAAGSIPAVAEELGEIGVIWIDAHGDFNSDKSTPSGNMHGMPLSAVCGCGPEAMVSFSKARVSPRHVAQVGARDLDAAERARLRENGVSVFSISDIDKLGMAEVMRRAMAVAGEGTKGIHLSFDVDAITPEAAPGVGTPVHSGLTVREAFLAAEMLAESGRVVSLDMVEVNPMLDAFNKTGALACELILSVLGKTVY